MWSIKKFNIEYANHLMLLYHKYGFKPVSGKMTIANCGASSALTVQRMG
jgi:hypothetical protein